MHMGGVAALRAWKDGGRLEWRLLPLLATSNPAEGQEGVHERCNVKRDGQRKQFGSPKVDRSQLVSDYMN